MALFLKIVPGKFDSASRDKRELSVIQELGHQVIVIAKGENNKKGVADGFEVHCRTTRPLGNAKWLTQINRLVSLVSWSVYVKNLKPDCISCHGLIALFIGWLSTWFTPLSKRPLLVYDSHEFEIGRNTAGKSGKIKQWVIPKVEKFLIGKSVFTIMVSDSIANEVQKIYHLKTRPVVVRNIANYWNIDQKICRDRRKEFCSLLKIPENTFLVMYHGGIREGRGIENLIRVVAKINSIALIIMGYGEEEYLQKLKMLVNDTGMGCKVLFHDAVPIEILWQYLGAVDLGAITIPNTCGSYYYCLPNKLFENIQAETPMIGNNFPEIIRIIEGYNIGLCCDPHNLDEIAANIEKMRDDKALYAKMKENLKSAKKELCWENEKKVLIEAYTQAFGRIGHRREVN
jgi:glycosyltransferase involved in cell wall biosynthesis